MPAITRKMAKPAGRTTGKAAPYQIIPRVTRSMAKLAAANANTVATRSTIAPNVSPAAAPKKPIKKPASRVKKSDASKSNTAAPPAPTKPASKPLQKPVTTAPKAKVFSASSAAPIPVPAADVRSPKRGRAESEKEAESVSPRPSQRARSEESLGDEEVTALNASAKNKRKRDDKEEVGGEATGEDVRGSPPKRQTVMPAAARASVRLVAAQFAAAGPAPAAPEKIKIPPPPRGFTKAQWLKIHTDLINAEHARRAGVNGSVPAAAGSAPRPASPQANRSINVDRAAWFVAENARQHSRRRSGSGEFWAKGGDWGVGLDVSRWCQEMEEHVGQFASQGGATMAFVCRVWFHMAFGWELAWWSNMRLSLINIKFGPCLKAFCKKANEDWARRYPVPKPAAKPAPTQPQCASPAKPKTPSEKAKWFVQENSLRHSSGNATVGAFQAKGEDWGINVDVRDGGTRRTQAKQYAAALWSDMAFGWKTAEANVANYKNIVKPPTPGPFLKAFCRLANNDWLEKHRPSPAPTGESPWQRFLRSRILRKDFMHLYGFPLPARFASWDECFQHIKTLATTEWERKRAQKERAQFAADCANLD